MDLKWIARYKAAERPCPFLAGERGEGGVNTVPMIRQEEPLGMEINDCSDDCRSEMKIYLWSSAIKLEGWKMRLRRAMRQLR